MNKIKCRLKLALKVLLGYDIIVYEENTKIVNLIINGCLDIEDNKHTYCLDKGNCLKCDNGEIRYLGDING